MDRSATIFALCTCTSLLLVTPVASEAGNETSEQTSNGTGNFTPLAMASLTSSRCIARLDQDCFNSCGEGAFCSWGHCYCDSGTCAGLDDRCHPGNYERLSGTYRISNSRWPDHFIQMRSVGGASVTTDDGDKTEFYISVVPGPANGGLAVLLTSVKWPDHALAMDDYDFRRLGNATLRRTSSSRRREIVRLTDKFLDDYAEVEDTASLLYIPPVSNPNPNVTMVMIRGIDDNEYAYVARGSWGISGDDDDQGAGSYWYIDPPLPQTLVASMHAYLGDRCDFDCGDPLISGAMSLSCQRWLLIQGAIAITMLLVGGPLTF